MFQLENLKQEIIPNTSFEYTEQKMLTELLRDGDRVLQLGANIGTSCIAAEKSNELSYNICVEPSDNLQEVLHANLERNRVKNTEVVHGVLGRECAKQGRRYLDASFDTGNNDWARSVSQIQTPGGQEVKCFELEDIAKGRGLPDVIAADCEGCLPELVASYPELIRHARVLVFERDGAADYQNTFRQLNDEAFTCTRVFSEEFPMLDYYSCVKKNLKL